MNDDDNNDDGRNGVDNNNSRQRKKAFQDTYSWASIEGKETNYTF
jgi:hypothetical protein